MLKPIRAGDEVHHEPSDEMWVVAYVDGDRLAWCGWPPGTAALKDCKLVKSCSDEEHLAMLERLAAMSEYEGYDHRKSHAIRALEALDRERRRNLIMTTGSE